MKKSTREIFKERLIIAREKKGVSRTQAAKDMDINRGSIDTYENGTRTPDVLNLKKIAAYYNVSIDYLLGMKEHECVNNDFSEISDYLGVSTETVEAIKGLGEREKHTLSNVLIKCKNDFYFYSQKIYVLFNKLEEKRKNIAYLKNTEFMADTVEYINLEKALSIFSNERDILQYALSEPEIMRYVDHFEEEIGIFAFDFKEDEKFAELITVAQKELDYAIENNVLDNLENLNFMNMKETRLFELLYAKKNLKDFFNYIEDKFTCSIYRSMDAI